MSSQNKRIVSRPPSAISHNMYTYKKTLNPNRLGGVVHQKMPPYNTGKVQIGIAYQPPYRGPFSRDEELLQQSLIDTDPALSLSPQKIADVAVMVTCLLGLVVVAIVL